MKKRAVPKGNKNIYIIFGLLALIFGILIYLSMQNKRREGMKSADKKSATDSESDNTESATETTESASEKPASKKPASKKPAETGTEAAITDMLNNALKKTK